MKFTALLFAVAAHAQINVGVLDQLGTSLPATCTVGQRFFKSDATLGQNSYACTSLNMWTVQGGSGSGTVTSSGTPLNHQIAVWTTATNVKGIAVGASDKPLVGVSSADPIFSNLTLTNPTTFAALTLADNSSLITSGAFSAVLTFSATTNSTFPAGTKTLLATDGSGASLTGIPISITGTSNQISASASTGAITLSLPATIDLSAKTLRIPNSTSLPGTCSTGDSYMDTDATTGQRFYLCESANTWVKQGDGAGGGSGTVNPGTSGQLSYYPATAAAISGNANLAISNGALTVGVAGTTAGSIGISNVTAGVVTLQNLSSGAYNFNLPSTAGSLNNVLLSGGGGSTSMGWGSRTGNAVVFATATGTITASKCAEWNSDGNLIATASACGSGGGVSLIASGTTALATSAILSGACQTVTAGSVNSSSASGVATTDTIIWTPNVALSATNGSGVTGYTPTTSGGLSIMAYPTTNNVNFDVCNWSGASISPGAVSLNWRVVR